VNIISSRLVQGEPVYDPAHNCGATSSLPGPAEFASGQAVIGTGPYVLKSYARGDSAVLARNPRFWGPKAPWPEVLFKPVPNGAARVAGLLAGDFDLIENPPSTDLPRLRADTRFAVEMTPTPRIIYLQPDVGREPSPFVEAGGRNPLKDIRVRRAIALAIDRRALVERVMDGAAVPAYQFLPDGMFGALEHAPEIPYDPAAARRLLAEAGYPDGFGLTLHASNDRYVNDAKVAQAVGQYLTRIGIRTNVVTLPVSVFFTQRRELKYSLAQGGWNATSGEAISFLRNWAMTASTAEGFGGANYGGFSDPALDDLVRTALATIDDNARRTLLQQATARAIAMLPEIPLYFESSSWAYRVGLSFKGRADQFTLATDVLPAR
jgi:peptide/nickel transport system substrate-binding protein